VKKVLVTGSNGFIGKNLIVVLKRKRDVEIKAFDTEDTIDALTAHLKEVDIVFHLAGVNRPKDEKEFQTGNIGLSKVICDTLLKIGKKPFILFSSSIQASLDNHYGISKRKAEDLLFELSNGAQIPVAIFRLPGVFGKWCRPNYNSVVATFCYNITRGLPINISDPENNIELVYIDDVMRSFIKAMEGSEGPQENGFYNVTPTYTITLGKLADTIYFFRDSRKSLQLSDFNDRFTRCLFATYLSYLPADTFDYPLEQRRDQRGELAELLKSSHFGQIFVSRTRPGIIRGNHYHDTKVEKFMVLEGDAVIRFRHILEKDSFEYPLSGRDFRVVDIPPGYTHSIENVGNSDLIVLFWADEIFEPSSPDTFPMPVLQEK